MPVLYTKDLLSHLVSAHGFEIGDFTYGLPTVIMFDEGRKLTVGRYCSIAAGVSIFLGGNHRVDWVTTYPFSALPDVWPEVAGVTGHPTSNGDVCIGHDVWIGTGATIMSGVTVGHGSVVAAHALVTRDVAPYAIVGGNPARVIRHRFSLSDVQRLLDIGWWDGPDKQVREHLPSLVSADIETFFARASAIGQGAGACVP